MTEHYRLGLPLVPDQGPHQLHTDTTRQLFCLWQSGHCRFICVVTEHGKAVDNLEVNLR
ncbi:hypothetical protein D3C85_1572970 [compost metagenome]